MTTTESGPQRTCVGCLESKNPAQLVRYAVAPDGALLVDYRHRLPGRGAYTCIDLQCLKVAVERNQFQRSFKGNCNKVDFQALRQALSVAVLQKIVNLLGMGRKSGQIISGSNSVLAELKRPGSLALVIMTEDISFSIAEKIRHLCARQQVKCNQRLSKEELGRILGKSERSVVAVESGKLADAILFELQRYEQLVREN